MFLPPRARPKNINHLRGWEGHRRPERAARPWTRFFCSPDPSRLPRPHAWLGFRRRQCQRSRSSSVATHHPRIVPLLDPSIGNTFPSIQPSSHPSTVDRRPSATSSSANIPSTSRTHEYLHPSFRDEMMDILSPPKGPRARTPYVRIGAFSDTPSVRTLFPPFRATGCRCASIARLSFGVRVLDATRKISIHATRGYPSDDAHSTTLCTHTHTHRAHSKQTTKTKNKKRSCIFAGKARLHNPARGRGKERKEKNIIDAWTRVYPIPSTS